MRAMTLVLRRLCLVAKGRGRKRQRPTTTLVAASDRHRQSVRRGNPGHRHGMSVGLTPAQELNELSRLGDALLVLGMEKPAGYHVATRLSTTLALSSVG